jgi:FAD/FMN-containing dehydrogenase
MNDMSLTTLESGSTTVSAPTLDILASQLRGRVLHGGDAAYDEARTIWNAMIDRRPGLVIRCAGASDVMTAVRFARTHGLLLAVRSGGHNIAGNAVCEGGLLIDLSQMRSVRVDSGVERAWVEPGATLGDVDKETQAFGLAVPLGINSTTGIAGLTLGGGFGWTTRKLGLTIDNLIAADVVTAEGERVRASLTENKDLFWAIRGGGGNFGVVTAFQFQLHRVGPQVLSGLVVYPFEDVANVLRDYREALQDAPDELTCWAVMRQAPPLPFLPEAWHGRPVVVLAICWCGDMAAGERATARLRSLGNPIADVVGPTPFVAWQQAFDPLLTPGARNYWKSHDLIDLTDPTIDILRESAETLPGPECEIFVAHVGGAAGRIATEATAFPQRSSHFVMNVHARWREAAMDQACIDWARGIFEAMKPHAAGTAYVNFMPDDETSRVESVYAGNYARLVEAKRLYDPLNIFRMNQNIMPAVERRVA